jgi:hypothetical protein
MSDISIGWYVAAPDASTASIRLRCLVPMAELRRQGRRAAIWQHAEEQSPDAVIFSKIYDDHAYEAARMMRRRGIRVLLDLCDNHWFGEAEHPAVARRTKLLERMLTEVDRITASTPLLAQQITERFARPVDDITVVPDPVLPPQPDSPGLRGRLELMGLRRHLDRHSSAYKLIWFGNHGAGHVRSGMEDLDRIRSFIDEPDGRFSLTVLSNSRAKYRRLFKDWRLPTHYMPWRLGTVDQVLAMHDCAVVPVTLNGFTAAKTMNRPAMALMAGLEVFADSIPSYEELAPFITLDDWPQLIDEAQNRTRTNNHIEAAQNYLRTHYSVERVAEQWFSAINQALF